MKIIYFLALPCLLLAGCATPSAVSNDASRSVAYHLQLQQDDEGVAQFLTFQPDSSYYVPAPAY